MITIDDIRAFIAVAKYESFVQAADDLFITPPALSRRIKKLEEHVGEKLFHRTTQAVAITPSGQVLLERSNPVLRDFEALKEFAGRFANDQIVKIRFGCMWSTAGEIVPRLIRDYIQIYKGAEFEVQDAEASSLFRLVRERQIDFAITMRPGKSDADLQFEPICKDPIMLACPMGHPLYDRSTVSWTELQSKSIKKVDWGIFGSLAIGSLAEDVKRENIAIDSSAKILHLATQLKFLDAHLTAVILPSLGISLARAPTIKAIPIVKPEFKREIGILSVRNSPNSKAVSSFVEHVKKNFVEHYEKSTAIFQ